MKKDTTEPIKQENEPEMENGETAEESLVDEVKDESTEEEEIVEDEKDELAEIKDRHLRLYSEFENYRRRTAKEKLDVIATANADLVLNLLPVLDDFERAMKAMDADNDKDSFEGINHIYKKFRKTLDGNGLTEIKAGKGSTFDVELHEAISQIPAPSKKLNGKIIDVVEKGYLLKGKVIRFAKVVVGS